MDANKLTPRQQRGIALATAMKLVREDMGWWKVPSQSGNGRYRVCLERKVPFCSCPDHEETGQDCKHIYAVRYVMERQQDANGNVTVTETFTVAKRTQYPQNKGYDLALTTEKDRVQELLFDLCSTIPQPARKPSRGRPPVPLAEQAFCAVYKVYTSLSTRRFMSDLRTACERGYLSRLVHFTTVADALDSPTMTPILQDLIAKSSLPLRAVETNFAIDSTGFGTLRYRRWYDEKYGGTKTARQWVKCHICTGVTTNVVAAAVVSDGDANDSPFLPELVKATAVNFKIGELSADKAYTCNQNIEAALALGAQPFFPFRANATGGVGGEYERLFHEFCLHRAAYMKRYHLRSNAESTFSAIKRKFGDFCRSKGDVAIANELRAKLISQNLCCLVQAECELGIKPAFREGAEVEPAILPLVRPG